MQETDTPYQTMGYSTPDRIVVRGKDLCAELIGKINFGDMIFLEVVGRLPTPSESRMTNAVLVCLVEHGVTPTAVAARLTALGAPAAIQGAIAAGVLGAGEVFLGAVDGAARMFQRLATEAAKGGVTERDLARAEVQRVLSAGERLPGFGHPVHKPDDPRTVRLFELAEEEGTAGFAQRIALLIREEAETATGKVLPINADGGCAAVLTDLGFPALAARGFVSVSRAGGVLGHVMEELLHSTGRAVWAAAEEVLPYRDPEPLF